MRVLLHFPWLGVTLLVLASCHRTPQVRSNEVAPTEQRVDADPQETSPDETSTPPPPASLLSHLPERLALEIDLDYEHGCSQSHESRGFTGAILLELGTENGATMTLELDELTILGPSYGAYRLGERDFSQIRTVTRRVMTGRRRIEGDELIIDLERIANSSTQISGYGTPTLPPPTEVAARASIVCREGQVDAYPPEPDAVNRWSIEGQTASPLPVLLCRFSEELFDLEPEILVDGAYPLATPTLTVNLHSFYGDANLIFRRSVAEQ